MDIQVLTISQQQLKYNYHLGYSTATCHAEKKVNQILLELHSNISNN